MDTTQTLTEQPSFLTTATRYLLHGVADPSDDQLHRAGQFGLWLAEQYETVDDIFDLREASLRWERDGGEHWRDEGSPFMQRELERQERAQRVSSGIAWQPGTEHLRAGARS